MSDFCHIVLGYPEKGSIKAFLQKHKEHIYFGEIKKFREDLSIGSIYKLEQNLDQRVRYFKQIFNTIGEEEFLKFIDKEIDQTYNLELDIEEDKRIIIWHGYNTREQISLRYLVSKFSNNKIFEVSVSKSIEKEFKGEKYRPRSTGECSPEEMGKALDNISFMENDEREKLIYEWNELRNSKATLRILKDNKIVTVNEDYYDKDILKYTPQEFTKAARVVGNVMGLSEQVVGDTFINYRLRKLIEAGKIVYKGKLRSIREFDIKLK